MASLTINIEEPLKIIAQKKAQKDGVTLTFIVIQALKAYNEDKLKFGLVSDDDEVTASFDVSTNEGKRACIKNFEALIKGKKSSSVPEDLKNLLGN
ncbi:MAG: hypothetical protein PHP74_00505 [Candidatus Gracilibacteria bacterium]|nr:hypothetical protein [Candidatus Gracilibacteria bacterium]